MTSTAPIMPAQFIDTQELGPTTLGRQLQLIRLLKAADHHRACPLLLSGASLGMIFEEASTRTRVSFEVAMTKLGGHALYLKPGEIHLGEKENIADTARVLSRMVDVVEIRAFHHETVTSFARYASVPVINGLTDYNHPTQALCDVFTMVEHKLPDKDFRDLTVVFIGDATNVCTSTAMIVTMLGGMFIHARPDAYSIERQWPRVIDEVKLNEDRYGGRYVATEEVEDAVRDADFVYTDLWWWFGQEAEIPERTTAFMPRYQVTPGLLARAPTHARFMHCLPASRGVEVVDEVMDGPQSIIYDQSENRLHTEKGLLAWYVYPRLDRATSAVKAHHEALVQDYLADVAP
jgi:putrescine carbamoyltransferase